MRSGSSCVCVLHILLFTSNGLSVLLFLAEKASTEYYPSKCSKICSEKSFFETELPENPEGNKGYQWAIQLLTQVCVNKAIAVGIESVICGHN